MNRKNLDKIIKEKKLDVIVSLSEQTKHWYTGVSMSFGFLFIEPKKATLFTDGRYIELAQKNAKNAKVFNFKDLKDFIKECQKKYKRIGIEKEYLSFEEQELLTKHFPKSKFIPISAHQLRIIKSNEETKKVRKACQIALKALEATKKYIKPGITEKEIDAHLEYNIRKLGANKGSFDAIVASGKRGALPHGRASNKKLKAGELVTIDFGAIYEGYCSDITRTFHVGKVTNKKILEIEEVLREAQRLGIKAVKPGVTTYEVDKVCRDYITKKGFGEYFVHSTGHGLGIDVHEKPVVTSNKKISTELKPGMIITVEPGIYIENFGGIRVEDDVLVTEKGHKVLSK